MQNYMTKNTYHRLINELENLKNIEIPKISKEKLEAARLGDLSENAEYEAAKEKLEMLHKRYKNLEERISSPIFIDDLNIPGSIASIGTKVTIKDIETNETITYAILGQEDSDVENNIISFLSPIAKGIIGKKEGDECLIQLPEGTKKVTIIKIEKYF